MFAKPYTNQLTEALLSGSSAVILVVFDADGIVHLFNPKAEQISGYRADEIVGRPIWEKIQPPEIVDMVREAIRQFKRGTPTSSG